MAERKQLDVSDVGDVTVVRFTDRRILDANNIEELGEQLFAIVNRPGGRKLLLNFREVEFLSSAALNKLIILDKKTRNLGGKLKLSNLRPEIHEVFVITRLNQLFDIHEEETDALASFTKP